MGTYLASHSCVDEDYIDMEIRSSPPSKPREFEFQMLSTSTTKTTADDLFFNGKLLPLHHLPRRRHLLAADDHHFYSLPFLTCSTAPCTDTTTTPLDSCNISPSESCRPSCDLNSDDTFFQWSNELTTFITTHQPKNNPWPKKLKHKLRTSRAYLKSLFTKSDESAKICRKIAAMIKKIDRDSGNDENAHRKSFSGALKRLSPTSSSSSDSSSSLSSLKSNDMSLLRRSSNASEIEGSIDAAIAHCKKSMQSFQTREFGFCSLSA